MGVHTADNKLVITTEPKSFCFDLLKDPKNNLKHEIYSIIKYSQLLADHVIKNEIRKLMFKYNRNNINHTNSFSAYHKD